MEPQISVVPARCGIIRDTDRNRRQPIHAHRNWPDADTKRPSAGACR